MKKGIYETTYGNAAYVSGPKAKTAFDLDMGEKIPLSEVTTKFIRKAESYDTPSAYNSRYKVITKIENQYQLRRTVEALAETRGLIAKEKAYREDLQKADYLASLVAHEAKLERMIKDFFPLPIIELNEGSKQSLARALKGNP